VHICIFWFVAFSGWPVPLLTVLQVAAVPVQVVVAVILLYQILGWSSIAGIVVMILLIPINYTISNRFSVIQKAIMSTTDKRIHATNEVLQNIRIIKFFAWEERFGHMVGECRSAELRQLRNRYILWAIAATSWYGSPMVITFLSFLSYTVIEGKELNASVAFTALSLFNVLRVPLDQLADMVTNVLQAKVSVDRVEEFLREEETEKYHQLRYSNDDPNAPLIGFRDASFTWGSKQQAIAKGTSSAFQLQGLNIEFAPGQLNIIAGATGSGKTSLLMALLGEMTHLKGRQVSVPIFQSIYLIFSVYTFPANTAERIWLPIPKAVSSSLSPTVRNNRGS
jgi:ABC-type multidrug transport system fused ATPase/permease subunit